MTEQLQALLLMRTRQLQGIALHATLQRCHGTRRHCSPASYVHVCQIVRRHCQVGLVEQYLQRSYQVKGLLGTILEVSTQAGFQILGGHIPLRLHCLLPACTTFQLAQVQCCSVSHLATMQTCDSAQAGTLNLSKIAFQQ